MIATAENATDQQSAPSTICDWCGQDMTDPDTVSCTLGAFEDFIGEGPIHRIRYGLERGSSAIMPDERCDDCGVRAGGLHHPGCDTEQCPNCLGQAVGCDCPIDRDDDETDE